MRSIKTLSIIAITCGLISAYVMHTKKSHYGVSYKNIFYSVVMKFTEPQTSLTKKEYSNGKLREADVIKRLSPRLNKALKEKNLKLGSPVFIRIFKESGELEIWVENQKTHRFDHFKTWRIAAMSGKLGPKTAEGDYQAPEGFYYVPPSRMKPDSAYHLAFNIGYPNQYDLNHNRTGSFIMVHGNRVSIGCYAMTDRLIEEIYTLCHAALKNGQPYFRVHAFPFRMTPEKMATYRSSHWYPFWKNLQEGYSLFEKSHIPPKVKVIGKNYHFE